MEKVIKKVSVGIYRDSSLGDCTNGGLTSKVDSAWLFIDCTREEAIAYCELKDTNPNEQLFLERRELPWTKNADYVTPLVERKGLLRMFGGNFVYTSDSRFREYCGTTQPLPVHDRYETQEQYGRMSI